MRSSFVQRLNETTERRPTGPSLRGWRPKESGPGNAETRESASGLAHPGQRYRQRAKRPRASSCARVFRPPLPARRTLMPARENADPCTGSPRATAARTIPAAAARLPGKVPPPKPMAWPGACGSKGPLKNETPSGKER